MLRCIHNTNGVMGLTLSQVGLFLATGILLTVVVSLVFSSEWQRTAELESQASSFSNLLYDIENSFFDRTGEFRFSQEDYSYNVRVSTEYLVISSKGACENNLIVTKKLLTSPWPRTLAQNWTTGQDLHAYLNLTFGHWGTENDSISIENITTLCRELNNSTSFFAFYPLEIQIDKPVYIEKVTIFYDQTRRYDLVLIYQVT